MQNNVSYLSTNNNAFGGSTAPTIETTGLFQPYYPYYPTTYITYTTPAPNYEIQIRKASNGFVVLRNGVEYVFESVEKMTKFIAKEMEK